MSASKPHEDIFADWLHFDPLVVRRAVKATAPSLADNTADLDRLRRALRQQGYDPLRVPPGELGAYAARFRHENFEATAVLSYTGDGWELTELFLGTDVSPILGVAVDLGTTQIAFYLVDLITGHLLDRLSVPNPQIPYGEDILTRIIYASTPKHLRVLQDLLRSTINETLSFLADKHGFRVSQIYALTVAGNTTMTHFFLGLDPSRLCKEPYVPVANTFPMLHGKDLQLAMHPRGLVVVFPNVGSYFGGDVIAGILATGMHRTEEICLLVDVGTNAEVVLGNKDWLVACAGAAGPALEGGVVERGMMAQPGAIDRVRIDPESMELTYHVLGEEKPKGLCGSGLIDLVAEMFMAGLLTIQGKINTKVTHPRIVAVDSGPAYVVAWADETADGRDLLVSEIDIGILLKSKAAMYTILNIITRKVGLSVQDIRRFFVAGTFGSHIDPVMAIRIGMLPDLPLETYQGLGNTAGRGAAMTLLDRRLLGEMDEVRQRITYVELNVNLELMNEFRGATFLPHTDPKLFPSVTIHPRAMG
ncbi:MAG: ASKHA domain-containing protein [Desulfosoma sp.]|uniref:ASKHA domain-containing protein n=1 Tax=Desulfosoma sp. TaxID=2603217 RepID=UPI00404A9CF3